MKTKNGNKFCKNATDAVLPTRKIHNKIYEQGCSYRCIGIATNNIGDTIGNIRYQYFCH